MGLTQKEIQNKNKMLFGPANNRFDFLGKIEGQPININLKENTTPYHISAPRHVALPLLVGKVPLKKELDRMLNLGVIKKVDEPT